MASTLASGRFRTDIQALRGLAILLVILHHTRLVTPLKAGYLGVDIFFVISGYLITGIVQRGLNDGTFSFAAFYFRRAKRLLPAAYVTFVATSLLSVLFLTGPEMRDFIKQLLGAVTFTGNIALWMQTGYFESSADLKPLLHVWSLSIEEQYYMLLPAALVFTPRRFRRAGVGVLTIGSLVLCFSLVSIKPGATFYLLPTRAWELLLGSLATLVLEGSRANAWLTRLFWPSLAVVLATPFFPTGAPHPGLDAMIVCVATLIIILSHHPLLNTSLPALGLSRLGDMSYSLYLVHWPLFAFAANAWVSPIPTWVSLSLMIIALLLAWALFRWVEQPVREAKIVLSRQSLVMALAATGSVVLFAVWIPYAQQVSRQVDFTEVRRGNFGLDAACEFGETFTPRSECRTSNKPRILIWGDSAAMHLVPAVVSSTEDGVIQATKSNCGPLIGASFFQSDGFYNRNWGYGCLRFGHSVLSYLESTTSIDVVVLSSRFDQYLDGDRVLVDSDPLTMRDTVEQRGGEDIPLAGIRRTVERLRAYGKRVVIVAPPPTSGFDVGRCLERYTNHKVLFGADNLECQISEANYRRSRARVLALLERIEREIDVPVLFLDKHLCQDGICTVKEGSTLLYRDGSHLSIEGSRRIGLDLGLAETLLAAAR